MESQNNENSKYSGGSYIVNKSKYSVSEPRGDKPAAPPQMKPIAEGRVKKRNFIQWISDTFLMASPKEIKKYFFENILDPAIRNGAVNLLTYMLFKRGDGYSSQDRGSISAGYSSYYKQKHDKPAPAKPSPKPEITFATWEKANQVLEGLKTWLATYKRVSMKELYEASGLETEWTMGDVGWRNLDDAKIIPDHGVYVLCMPKIESITN